MVVRVVFLFSLLYVSGLSSVKFKSLRDNSPVVQDAELEWRQLERVLAEEGRPKFAQKKRRPASHARSLVPDHKKTYRQSQTPQVMQLITPVPLPITPDPFQITPEFIPDDRPAGPVLPEFVRVPASKDLKPLFKPEPGTRTLPAAAKEMLLVTAPPTPAPTTRPPEIEVLCHIDRMYVRAKKSLFSTFDAYKYLKLGVCLVNQATAEHYYLLYLLESECGFHTESTEDEFLFSNVLKYEPESTNGIVREVPFDVPIQCRYHRIHHSFSVGYRPKLPEPVFRPLNSPNTGGVSLTAMDESGNPVNSFTMGKPMCFEAKLSSPKPGDRVYINECFVTDTPDPASTLKYTVIDNQGCMRDGMVTEQSKFLTCPRTKVKFCIGAFRFKQNLSKPSKLMYLHCEINLGTRDATKSLKTCSFDLRTRTWKELYGKNSVCACCSDPSCSSSAQPALRSFKTMVSTPPWEVGDGGSKMAMAPQFKSTGPEMEEPGNYADFLNHWETDYNG